MASKKTATATVEKKLSDMTPEEMTAYIQKLQDEKGVLVQQLAERSTGTISCKISRKTGSICVYGLQRSPVSLYAAQWDKLLSKETQDKIIGFMRQHKGKFPAAKGETFTSPADNVDPTGAIYTKVRTDDN